VFTKSSNTELKQLSRKASSSGKVLFELINAAHKKDIAYLTPTGTSFSHIYSFNVVFSKNDLKCIARKLNKTNFKVLVWCKNPRVTIDKLKVKDVCYVGRQGITYHGNKTTLFYYVKTGSASVSLPTGLLNPCE
jgi:hypothetical protein